MSLIDKLGDREVWEKFYEYKVSLVGNRAIVKELRGFIDSEGYRGVVETIGRLISGESGVSFALPSRSIISKQSSQKKRTVYTYPEAENMVLKLLTYLMLRKYNGLFTDDLYSFRPGRNAKDAVRRIKKTPGLFDSYTYKADVSDYFNSIPTERMLCKLNIALQDDPKLYTFLESLLSEPFVIDKRTGRKAEAGRKGIMAGTPQSAFFANLYLKELDEEFLNRGIHYARYSDDIIVFADTREKTEEYAALIGECLLKNGLTINSAKEEFRSPDEGFVFLGFSFCRGTIDVAPASVKKLKQKMRRKVRALTRWQERNDTDKENAAKAFIRIFNRKLLEDVNDNDLSWAYWYFPVINTTGGIHEIDTYAQECLRYLLSGKHTKARFNVKYEDLKQLGYRSLVNEYYKFKETVKA